jgi:hypothetical protein
MRKASTLASLTLLLALAPAVRAQEATSMEDHVTPPAPAAEAKVAAPAASEVVAAPVPTQTAASPSKLQFGASFLSMALGKYTYERSPGNPLTENAHFAYGLSLSGAYEVLPGLLVGLSPQVTFNVRPKTVADKGKQVDVLVRVAYAYRLPDGISVYAEALPGYSLILLKAGASPNGFALALGAGCTMDLTDRYFASLGASYQFGFQRQTVDAIKAEHYTRYLRVALGGGVRF